MIMDRLNAIQMCIQINYISRHLKCAFTMRKLCAVVVIVLFLLFTSLCSSVGFVHFCIIRSFIWLIKRRIMVRYAKLFAQIRYDEERQQNKFLIFLITTTRQVQKYALNLEKLLLIDSKTVGNIIVQKW